MGGRCEPEAVLVHVDMTVPASPFVDTAEPDLVDIADVLCSKPVLFSIHPRKLRQRLYLRLPLDTVHRAFAPDAKPVSEDTAARPGLVLGFNKAGGVVFRRLLNLHPLSHFINYNKQELKSIYGSGQYDSYIGF